MPRPKKKPAEVKLSIHERVAMLNEKYGAGTAIVASNIPLKHVVFMSTGSRALDFALGGGFPKNRITEIRGQFSSLKSTLCLQTIANLQMVNKTAVGIYLDVEKTFNANYAEKLGVDNDRLVVLTPESGEQGVDLVKDVCDWDVEILTVIDSIAALVPTKEIEDDTEKQNMGLQARLINKLMRVITARMKKSMYSPDVPPTSILAINQLRLKIGVLFGCLHADTKVAFADGRKIPIKEVVEKRIFGDVLSYNKSTGEIVETPILKHFHNGKVVYKKDWITITVKPEGKSNGVNSFTCTPYHTLFLCDGTETKAGNVKKGDHLKAYSRYQAVVVKDVKDVVTGCMLGDGQLSNNPTGSSASLRLSDSTNDEYLKWKQNLLDCFSWRKTRSCGRTHVETAHYEDLALFKYQADYNKSKFPSVVLSLKSFAIWYMDDGNLDVSSSHFRISIAVKRFDEAEGRKAESAVNLLFKKDVCKWSKRGYLVFSTESSKYVLKKISKYRCPAMSYKFKGFTKSNLYEWDMPSVFEDKIRQYPAEVVSITEGSDRKFRQRAKYDLQTEAGSYSICDPDSGIIVHNSPETTPGGVGKDFFYSIIVRLNSTPSMAIKDKRKIGKVEHEMIVAQNVGYKILKNKCCGTQYEEGEFTFYRRKVGEHPALSFDNIEPLFRYGLVYDVIKFDGDVYSVSLDSGEEISYKRDSDFKSALLKADQDDLNDLYMQILEKIVDIEGNSEVIEQEDDPAFEAEVEEVYEQAKPKKARARIKRTIKRK